MTRRRGAAPGVARRIAAAGQRPALPHCLETVVPAAGRQSLQNLQNFDSVPVIAPGSGSRHTHQESISPDWDWQHTPFLGMFRST